MRATLLLLASLAAYAVASASTVDLAPLGVSARLEVSPLTSERTSNVVFDLVLAPSTAGSDSVGVVAPISSLGKLAFQVEIGLDADAVRSGDVYRAGAIRFGSPTRLEIDAGQIPATVSSLFGRLVYADVSTGALMEVGSFSFDIPRARPAPGETCVKTSFADGRLLFDPPGAKLPATPLLAEVPPLPAAVPIAASVGVNALLLRLRSPADADVSAASAMLDAAAAAKIGAVVLVDFAPSNASAVDALVARFRRSPALLGWMAGDSAQAALPALLAADPCHPTLRSVPLYSAPGPLFEAAAASRGPLLLTAGEHTSLRDYADRLAAAVVAMPPRMPFWAEIPVPPSTQSGSPDAREWLAHAAAALVAGATGVHAAGSHEDAAGAAALGPALAEAVAAAGPFLVAGARSACGPANATAGDCAWGAAAAPGLLAAAWRLQPAGQAYPSFLVLALNPTDAPARFAVALPALAAAGALAASAGRLPPGGADWVWEDVAAEGYAVSDPRPLSPGEPRAYAVKRADAPTPVPAPTAPPAGPPAKQPGPEQPAPATAARPSRVAIVFTVLAVLAAVAAALPLAARAWRAYRMRAAGYEPIARDERERLYREFREPL